ncbi:hypothetical protein BHE74_00033818 [Ensete ventricosum]|nr:hypothetical protein BHE74_00033818 [Ensete ventricosum]
MKEENRKLSDGPPNDSWRQLSGRIGGVAVPLSLSLSKPHLKKEQKKNLASRVAMAAIGGQSLAISLVAVVVAAFLAVGAVAADAPAPSPTSAAGALSPNLTVAVLASSVVVLLGSLRH